VVGRYLPDEEYSDIEGKPLASVPKVRLRDLASGEYVDQLEIYLNDQLPARASLVETYMRLNMSVLDKVLMNSVLVGKGGQLLNDNPDPGLSDAEISRQVERSMSKFEKIDQFMDERGGRFVCLTHPSNNSFLRDSFPIGREYPSTYVRAAPEFLAALDKHGIDHIDMEPILEKYRDDGIYLRTDHHWSLDAGYLSYVEIVKRLGITPLSLGQDYDVTTFGPPIFGSLNRRLGMLMPSDETLKIAELKKPIPYEKTSNGKPDQAIYRNFRKDAEAGKPANYVGYMGGDRDRIAIRTNRPELPTLLVFGDSYTNTIEPFLWPHFNVTYILDLRYHTEHSLYDWVREYKPDYVVFVLKDEFFLGSSGNNDFEPTGGSNGGE